MVFMSLSSTAESTSQRAIRRTPGKLRMVLMCARPQSLAPITAMRISSFAPTIWE